MGLESGTTISQLDATWPIGATDQVAQGDDHLRLIKSVLKLQFPGALGQGFNTPITAKETDLNSIFTTGVKSCFYMAAAPTGWTIENPGTNYTLVSAPAGGTIGGGGGRSDNLVTGCTVVPDHSHAQQGTFVSGTSNQSLSHSHANPAGIGSFLLSPSLFNGTGGGANFNAVQASGTTSNQVGLTDLSGHNHNVTISGQTSNVNSGAGATGAIGTWQPTYALVIIAKKN